MKKLYKKIITFVFLLIVAMYISAPAYAWVTIGPTWSGDDTTMSLNAGDTWNPPAEDALFRWNSVAGSNFFFWFNNDNNDHCDRGTACIGTDGNAVEWDNFSNG